MSRLALSPIVTALVLAAAASAHAGTTGTLGSGADCVQAYSEEGNTTVSHDGGLYSWAPSWWRTAVCPIRQHSPYILNSTATVEVIDQSYDLDVTCRIVATRGGMTIWGAARTSYGSSPYRQTITVAYENGAHQIGRELLLCYLPQVYAGNRSGLLSYEATHTTFI